MSGGLFLTPRNLWNLSVQSSPVAIMATGMVLVIVTRNIDLSVGSMLGFIGMVMGVVQADLLPKLLGFEHPAIWIVALAAGLLLGIALGALQGFVIAYLGIPSFIVTLGGLLVWRGAAWWVTSGQTVAPLEQDLSSWAAARKARSARPGAGWSGSSLASPSSRCWHTAVPAQNSSTSHCGRSRPKFFLAQSAAR